MLEPRKQKEVAYYDRYAQEWLERSTDDRPPGDFEGFSPFSLASYHFCYEQLARHCLAKTVLDYGCGNGLHAVFLAKSDARKVVAIDLSEKSLLIAKKLAEKEGVADKIEFLKMDCEQMSFSDNSFDLIFDGGTFSSLDLNKAFPELVRVLRPDGFLIGIETLGHNPLTNLKRRLNRLVGKRTEWAVGHILKTNDLQKTGQYFTKIETNFFHLISWLIFPFLNLPGAKTMLRLLEGLERILLRFAYLKKYAFKVVFVSSGPKK